MTDHRTPTPEAAAAYEQDNNTGDVPDVDEYADLMSEQDRRRWANRAPHVAWWMG